MGERASLSDPLLSRGITPWVHPLQTLFIGLFVLVTLEYYQYFAKPVSDKFNYYRALWFISTFNDKLKIWFGVIATFMVWQIVLMWPAISCRGQSLYDTFTKVFSLSFSPKMHKNKDIKTPHCTSDEEVSSIKMFEYNKL